MKGKASNVLLLACALALSGAAAGCNEKTTNDRKEEVGKLALACTRVASCSSELGSTSASVDGCATTLTVWSHTFSSADAIVSCVNAAADCQAVGRCVNAGAEGEVCDATYQRRCDGSVVRQCSSGLVMGYDCTDMGMDCVEDTVSQLWCGLTDACPENSYCEGNGYVSCVNGVSVFTDCGEGSCVPSPYNPDNAACAGEGEACDGPVYECEGDTAVTCINGRIHREPCMPGLCTTMDGAFCKTGEECTESSCEGSTLIACISGTRFVIDCTELGFSTCAEEAAGPTCVPAR
jgi:hypothetical protein